MPTDATSHVRFARRSVRSRALLPLLALGIAIGAGTASTSAGPLGLFGPKGDSAKEQRDTVQRDSRTMLEDLFEAKPELRERLKKAAGYATFKQTNVHLLLVASSNGYGVLVDNATRASTYMRVTSLGGGVGMGVKDLRVIFIFNDPAVMRQFVDQGWQFGSDADATAKYENTGLAAEQTAKANVNFEEGTVAAGTSGRAVAETGDKSGKNSKNAGNSGSKDNAKSPTPSKSDPKPAKPTESTPKPAMEIYQFTESGISLQATVSGTKYWKDKDLNR